MVLKLFRSDGGEGDRLEEIERTILQMLADDRHSFDMACAALIGGADPETVGPDLRETDHRVNVAEQKVRRKLVVHASVHGTLADIPPLLVYMSIVKDIERIGDYAKNIFDLAVVGANFSDADDRDDLVRYRDRISELITECGQVFYERNAERATELLTECDEMADEFDDVVDSLVVTDKPGSIAVPRALYYRHNKRIVGHLMNLLSAVIMPLDMLDYFDEDHASRHR
jgi:phosphate transport system protein